MEHHLKGNMQRYPMIVIPECNGLDESMMTELRAYVTNGGKLLVIGSETTKGFSNELGITSSIRKDDQIPFIHAKDRLGGIRSSILNTTLMADSRALSYFYRTNDYVDRDTIVASSVRKLGKGSIAAIYFDAGSAYTEYKSPVVRDFIDNAVNSLAPDLRVEVSGSHLVHVALNEKNGKTYINLINIAGEHTNKAAIGYDQVPALTDLKVSIQGKHAKVRLQPEGRDLPVKYVEGKTIVTVPKVEIHSILEINIP
jgi:hypothetical protein